MIELVFPRPAKAWSTNEERTIHWAKRKKWSDAWKQIAYYEARGQTWPFEHAVVHVDIPFPDRRRRDAHNYCGTVVKAIVDGLVLGGIITDDDIHHLIHLEPTLTVGSDVTVRIMTAEEASAFMADRLQSETQPESEAA